MGCLFKKILSKIKAGDNAVEIRKIYHSCFLIKYVDGTTILIDPYFGKRFPSGYVVTEKCPISHDQLPKVDVLLITHEHFDHFDKEAIEFLFKRDKCTVVAPNNVLKELAVPSTNTRVIKVDDEIIVSKVKVKVISCQHPQSYYPVAFLLDYDGVKVYYAGDTISLPENKFDADIGILPAGGTFTADLFVFVAMARKLELKYAIPMHYNTFSVIKLDLDKLHERTQEKFKETKLVVLDNNKSFFYPLPVKC